MIQITAERGRHWSQMHAIYDSDDWHTVASHLFKSLIFSAASCLVFVCFNATNLLFFLPPLLQFIFVMADFLLVLSSFYHLSAAGTALYSLSLHLLMVAGLDTALNGDPDEEGMQMPIDCGVILVIMT